MTARFLVLLRHAKAETPAGIDDADRPLSARGHADAQAAGAWLGTRYVPELVICSPTKRTRQTWHGIAASLRARDIAASPVVRYERQAYEGGGTELLELMREIPDDVASTLVIGHNPGLSHLAYELDPDSGLDSDGLRTCGLTVHLIEGSWRACGRGLGPLAASYTARGD